MRCLYPDSEYFACLDSLQAGGKADMLLSAAFLVQEFPGLRMDEARAAYADWWAAKREGRVQSTQPARRSGTMRV